MWLRSTDVKRVSIVRIVTEVWIWKSKTGIQFFPVVPKMTVRATSAGVYNCITCHTGALTVYLKCAKQMLVNTCCGTVWCCRHSCWQIGVSTFWCCCQSLYGTGTVGHASKTHCLLTRCRCWTVNTADVTLLHYTGIIYMMPMLRTVVVGCLSRPLSTVPVVSHCTVNYLGC